MERLTKRDEFGKAYIIGVDGMDLQCRLGFDGFNKATNALNKLAGYEKLEEQGKLLKLPCAVGDTVYSFSMGKILTLRVDSFVIYTDGIDARLTSEEYGFLKIDMDIMDFGKKWFATHEEAEADLKEL